MKGPFVYFVRPVGMTGPIKIGCSVTPLKRRMQLSIWCPFELEVVFDMLGDLELERTLHECFGDEHLHNEWFRASDRLRQALDALVRGVPLHEAIDLTDRRPAVKPKRELPESQRLRQIYSNLVRKAEKRRRTADKNSDWVAPLHVRTVLNAWDRGAGPLPPASDLAVLDAYLGDLAPVSVTPAEERRAA